MMTAYIEKNRCPLESHIMYTPEQFIKKKQRSFTEMPLAALDFLTRNKFDFRTFNCLFFQHVLILSPSTVKCKLL